MAPLGTGAELTAENTALSCTATVTVSTRWSWAVVFGVPLVWKSNSSCTGFGSVTVTRSDGARVVDVVVNIERAACAQNRQQAHCAGARQQLQTIAI